MTLSPPLRERKQQKASEQLVEAAFALFAERGFSDVTVSDIMDVAALTPQLALACYHAGNRLAGAKADALGPAVDIAFSRLNATLDDQAWHAPEDKPAETQKERRQTTG